MKAFCNIFIFLVLRSVLNCKPTSEPIYSKFDYEEKLLAKTIRLENTVDDLVKTVTHVQTGLAECQADRQKQNWNLKWPRHKAIYFSWFGPELFCLLLGPPGFNCWFSSAPVFQWCCSTPQGSQGVGRNTFLSSPHLCFIIVFICDLFFFHVMIH